MNRFKEDVLRELQDVKLTDKKKREMAQKVLVKNKPIRGRHWQYRMVLSAFAIFAIGFIYLLWQGNETVSTQAATSDDMQMLDLLQYDLVKGTLFILFYVILREIVKRYLSKKYGLPSCVHCGEQWTYKEAFKLGRRNKQMMNCPHCGGKQYRTRASNRRYGSIHLILPLMVFTSMLFDQFIIGILLHCIGAFYIIFSINPYLLETQEKDSTEEPMW